MLKATIYDSSSPLPLSALCVAGAASGTFTSFVLTPIELVKCRMQVCAETPGVAKPGIIAIVRSVLRENGLSGLWRGQLGTLIRETGGTAAWFGSYEGFSAFFRARNARRESTRTANPTNDASIPIHQQLLAGAAAGMSYNFTFYPADTIKSRMQTDASASGVARQSFGAVGRALWKEQGLRGLYRGCGITVARSAPSSAIIFTIYESLAKAFL